MLSVVLIYGVMVGFFNFNILYFVHYTVVSFYKKIKMSK